MSSYEEKKRQALELLGQQAPLTEQVGTVAPTPAPPEPRLSLAERMAQATRDQSAAARGFATGVANADYPAMGRGVAQGATIGTRDEMAGAIGGIVNEIANAEGGTVAQVELLLASEIINAHTLVDGEKAKLSAPVLYIEV